MDKAESYWQCQFAISVKDATARSLNSISFFGSSDSRLPVGFFPYAFFVVLGYESPHEPLAYLLNSPAFASPANYLVHFRTSIYIVAVQVVSFEYCTCLDVCVLICLKVER